MILLLKPGLLFLKPHKVAGTSFEIALSRFADSDSIITLIPADDEQIRDQLGFRGPQNYEMNLAEMLKHFDTRVARDLMKFRRPRKFDEHISAKLAKKRLGPDLWSGCYKVTIVRNPFDMAVSRYFWSKRRRQYQSASFEEFCFSWRERFQENLKQYFIDQDEIINFYIRYESLRQDILKLEENFNALSGLADVFSVIKAKGSYRPHDGSTAEMFHRFPNAKRLINELCRFEIEKFGYVCP